MNLQTLSRSLPGSRIFLMRILLSTSLLIFHTVSFSQAYPGLRSSNYAGVNAVFFNPANIADSRHAFDLNLFSTHVEGANTTASLTLSAFTNSFKIDSLKTLIYGSQPAYSTGIMVADVHGPSIMVSVGKSAFALTTRVRSVVNSANIDGSLASTLLGYKLRSDNDHAIAPGEKSLIVQNTWSEYGFSFARTLTKNGIHFLKAGISLKYLSGVSSSSISLENFHGEIKRESYERYLTNASGLIKTAAHGMNLHEIDPEMLKHPAGKGIGADIGIVYEWRPEEKNTNENAESKSPGIDKYKIKIGLALLDVGKIKYDDNEHASSYQLSVPNDKSLNLSDLAESSVRELKNQFDNMPEFFTPAKQESKNDHVVALPSTLHLTADFHLHRGFYLNVEGQMPIELLGNNEAGNRMNNVFSITPRYEGKGLGIYLPVSFNSISKTTGGLALRLGNGFIGSASLFNLLFTGSKQADIFLGIRFGFVKKDK